MDIVKKLQEINWDFSDYNSARYPYDLNSIPWYPATFIPPIPKFLIASLTKPGDVVLDPFGGSGTTVIEAIKLNRLPIYNDINPFATDIVLSLLAALKYFLSNNKILNREDELKRLKTNSLSENEVEKFIKKNGINNDVNDWYHFSTLMELLSIIKLINAEQPKCGIDNITLIRKLAITSILKSASSQPGHFTYITDNCKPSKKVYKNALDLYINKIEQICLAAEDFIIQFNLANFDGNLNDLTNNVKCVTKDARNLNWIDDQSIDLVLTSPPYLCAQDYIKTMRLTNLFFPNEQAFNITVKSEIGSRSRRGGKSDIVVPAFYHDLQSVFEHIYRVLKPNGFFCLIMGKGKSKITADFNIISDLCDMLQNEYKFEKIFHQQRHIGNRVIRIGGVENEDIIIFRKNK